MPEPGYEAADMLGEIDGLTYLHAPLGSRKAFGHAAAQGLAVTELTVHSNNPKAAAEIMILFQHCFLIQRYKLQGRFSWLYDANRNLNPKNRPSPTSATFRCACLSRIVQSPAVHQRCPSLGKVLSGGTDRCWPQDSRCLRRPDLRVPRTERTGGMIGRFEPGTAMRPESRRLEAQIGGGEQVAVRSDARSREHPPAAESRHAGCHAAASLA